MATSYGVYSAKTGERKFSALIFETLEAAQELAKQLTTHDETGEVFFAKKNPDMDWKKREYKRFITGEYKEVAWRMADFWRDSIYRSSHYAHVSVNNQNLIAYTESETHGQQDRQTAVKPGVYLRRFFGDVLSEREIALYIQAHLTQNGENLPEVKIAATADDIQMVYENGPDSCMASEACDYSSRIHPVRVYGDSDLQLAYVEGKVSYTDGDYIARALIWPEKKLFGRVYPTPERYHGSQRDSAQIEKTRLELALSAMGYKYGRFIGARIKAVPQGDCYVMPYLDGEQGLDLIGDRFVIGGSEYVADTTNGLIEESGPTCECCDDRIRGDDYSNVHTGRYEMSVWCESCVSERAFYCDGSEEYFAEDAFDQIEYNGNTYSLRWAESNLSFCEHTQEWIDSGDAVSVNVASHGAIYQEIWSLDAAEDDAFACQGSGEYYSKACFDYVEIDGATYWREYAESDLILRDKLALQSLETESESN